MSELRHDPIYGHDVLIAPDRLLRPNAIRCDPWADDDPAACPFCGGHEARTPPATLELPAGKPPWQVRVIPNRYPIVGASSNTGRHEVVVESPDHVAGLLHLTAAHRELVFTAYRSRFRVCAEDPTLRYALLFKNQGRLAGASLPHVHSQFVALSQPPDAIGQVWANARSHFNQAQRCVFCQRVEAELECGARLVDESDAFLAFCPAASRAAYEIWILPKGHASHFERIEDDELRQFGEFVSLTLARLENTVKHVAYNYAIQSAPFDSSCQEHYHWHMVISPRITGIAGFELSTGVFVNPLDPQIAARQLRDALTTFPLP